MAEDVPALQAMKPGGKEHPIDKVLHDGDAITLGNARLLTKLRAPNRFALTRRFEAQLR